MTKKIYYVLFTIFVIPQAVADNFATLIVTRVIAGGLGGIVQNAVESVIADTWRDEDERNLPITLFVFVFIAGFTVGPIIGAAIASHLYWRWCVSSHHLNTYAPWTNTHPHRVFYIQLIIYAASFPFIFFLLKETRHSVILTKRAVLLEKRSSTGQRYYAAGSSPSLSPASIIYDAIIRPTRLFCTEPIVFFFTAWSAFAFGLVFISTQSIGQVYTQNYNFTLYQTGYVQTALLAGEALGCIACLPQNTYYLRSGARSRDGNPIPEARLPLSIPASFIGLAGGLFWYAWTSADPSLPWILPTVGLGFVGFGIMCVVHAVVNYLTDAYTLYAASAIAAEAFGENVLAAFLPLAAKRMYAVLGFGWASSLLGFAALGLSFAPIVLVWKGGEIRRRSRFLQRARGGRA